MSRYIMGNRNTEKYITVIEPQSLRPQCRGRKSKASRTEQAVTQRTEEPRNISHRFTTRFQSNEGSSSTQTSHGLHTSLVNTNQSTAPDQRKKTVSDMKLKERLIHLLVLRPHKKSELYNRIYQEGIKECERSVFMTLLNQVAFVRDGAYHLKENVKNIQEEWPFYTEEEKAMLRARKLQNVTTPGPSDSSSGSGQPSTSTYPGSFPVITAHVSILPCKRPADHEENDLSPKRLRVSRSEEDEAGTDNNISISFSGNTSGADNGKDSTEPVTNINTEQPAVGLVSVASAADYGIYRFNVSAAEHKENASDFTSGTDTCVNSLPDSNIRDNGDDTSATVSCVSNSTESPEHADYVDFLVHYTTINNTEQKSRYKADFNAVYDEYTELHTDLMKVWQQIADLEDRLNQFKESGNQKEFEEMRQHFFLVYKTSKNDPQRLRKERRFYYLHHKLAHIKRMVEQYDMLNAIANIQPEEQCE